MWMQRESKVVVGTALDYRIPAALIPPRPIAPRHSSRLAFWLRISLPVCLHLIGEKHGTTLCDSKILTLQRYGETGERHENIIQQMMLRERTYKAKPAGYLSVQQPSTVQLLESLL